MSGVSAPAGSLSGQHKNSLLTRNGMGYGSFLRTFGLSERCDQRGRVDSAIRWRQCRRAETFRASAPTFQGPPAVQSSLCRSCPPRTSPAYSTERLPMHPAAGARNRETGALIVVGEHGNVWSSSSYAAGNLNVGGLHCRADNVNPLNGHNRANGLSVRCVQHLHGNCFIPSFVFFHSLRPGVARTTVSASAVLRFSNPPELRATPVQGSGCTIQSAPGHFLRCIHPSDCFTCLLRASVTLRREP